MSSSSDNPAQTEETEKQKTTVGSATPSPSPSPSPGSPSTPNLGQVKQPATTTSTSSTTTASAPPPSAKKEAEEGPLLFHFAECTNCHHILPISTNTEKYFPILSKEPKKPKGLGEKCMRCGADSWVLVVG